MDANSIEIYINREQVDTFAETGHSYEFESPIFRDVTKILANRTYSFELPLTDNNRRIFGFCDMPEIETNVPYQTMEFEERREGITFITGKAQIESIKDDAINLLIVWGNSLSLLSLKDLKLRDITTPLDTKLDTSLPWNKYTLFLNPDNDADKETDAGFLVADFGKGTLNVSESVPSVNITYLLHLLGEYTRGKDGKGITFAWPERFTKLFRETWIPLTDHNFIFDINDKYYRKNIVEPLGFSSSEKTNYSALIYTTQGGADFTNHMDFGYTDRSASSIFDWKYIRYFYSTVITGKKGYTAEFHGCYKLKSKYSYEKAFIKPMKINFGTINGWYQSIPNFFNYGSVDVQLDDAGHAYCDIDISIISEMYDNQFMGIYFQVQLNNNNKLINMEDWEISLSEDNTTNTARIHRYPKDASYDNTFQIIPNLPDIQAKDLLATIMNMFGLFTYFNFKPEEGKVQFLSIDDIYSDTGDTGFRAKAVDWTDKLVDGGKEKIEFKYNNYANKNYLRYAKDDKVETEADGIIEVNGVLEEEKNLLTLPFAPSDNIGHADSPSGHAYIPYFKNDNSTQTVKLKILAEKSYRPPWMSNRKYKSLIFPEEFKYEGEKGLLKTYFSSYQRVLKNPYVRTCSFYLDNYDLLTFKEIYPIILDGIYYIPMKLTVQSNNIANAVLLKMPLD